MLKLGHDEHAHSADLFCVLDRLMLAFDNALLEWALGINPFPVSAHGDSKE